VLPHVRDEKNLVPPQKSATTPISVGNTSRFESSDVRLRGRSPSFAAWDDISLAGCKKAALQKIVSLSLADRAVEFFQHRHHVFPNFAFLTGRLVPQQIRRVIGDHERGVVIGMPFAT